MASGLVVLIPLVVTVAVIRFLFGFTSGILLPIVDPRRRNRSAADPVGNAGAHDLSNAAATAGLACGSRFCTFGNA